MPFPPKKDDKDKKAPPKKGATKKAMPKKGKKLPFPTVKPGTNPFAGL